MNESIILETKNLVKNFNGTLAVNGLNLRVQKGHIHALIGPNGAGKTTVFSLLTGFLTPTSGDIFFQGEKVTRKNPALLAAQGLVRSFQISAVFADFTALENVRVALQNSRVNSYSFWKSEESLNSLNTLALDLLQQVGIAEFQSTAAGELSYGRKRALEIATTLAADPSVMLLDEPTAGMGHEDVGLITNLIKKVATNRTVLLVEHNLKVVSTLADRITVLQRGAILSEGSYDVVAADPRVIEAYMGVVENVG